ncbi:hypothetical protein ACIRRH_08850 [Kitasatospora sp. NPDC101235]
MRRAVPGGRNCAVSVPPNVDALPVDFARWPFDVAERHLRG